LKLRGYIYHHGTYAPLWGVSTLLLNFLIFMTKKPIPSRQ